MHADPVCCLTVALSHCFTTPYRTRERERFPVPVPPVTVPAASPAWADARAGVVLAGVAGLQRTQDAR